MAQFENELIQVVVDGKACFSTIQKLLPAYVVRIWSQCRAEDRLYHEVESQRYPVDYYDIVDLSTSNTFVTERCNAVR